MAPSRSVTAAHAVTAVGFWPRGLQADRTDHGAHRQERRVVRAVADHRTGHIWTLFNEARDPGQIEPSTLMAAGDEETTAVCQVAASGPRATARSCT